MQRLNCSRVDVQTVGIVPFVTFCLCVTPIITTALVNLLSQVRLIDAGFLWTEPHSKRIKMKVTIQKEVRKQWKKDVWESGI